MSVKIGAVVIGQSPRPDLVAPLVARRPDVQIVQVGALDGLTAADLPDVAEAMYPLTTRMRDGSVVTVAEDFLAPLMQEAVVQVEEVSGVAVTVLLCAGTFAGVKGVKRPLVKPFETAVAVLKSMGMGRLGILSPIYAQERPIRRRWSAAGFDVEVWTPPYEIGSEPFEAWMYQVMTMTEGVEGVVFDYVGYPAEYKEVLQEMLGMPVIDLGDLVLGVVAGMV